MLRILALLSGVVAVVAAVNGYWHAAAWYAFPGLCVVGIEALMWKERTSS
jgi:hypothetical protein